MKKSLLALAVLGAFAGVASAQSSVTLSGTIDVNARYIKNDGSDRRLSLSTDGINSTQLVFSGVEDLGGGLKAGFVLNSGGALDTGRSSGDTAGKFWNRRATVSLLGGFGEVRLGRDYSPTFWSKTVFDAFGTNGIGSSLNVAQIASTAFVRNDNTINYYLPGGLGGFYGWGQVAASEGAATNAGRYIGGRVGFAAGPFDIAGAYSQQRYDNANPALGLNAGSNYKEFNIAGSFDFGVAKIQGWFARDTTDLLKQNEYHISGIVPLGQGEIHAGYNHSKLTPSVGADNTVKQFNVGYVYNLSKRTALYSTFARLSNGNLSRAQVGPSSAAVTAGGKSTGFEAGVRHFF